jgi:hypothetical protein
MPFVNIKQIIPQSAKQHQAEAQFTKYQIITAWGKVSPGFFTEAAELTKAVNFEKGTLYVACLSKDLYFAIRQLMQQILRALNEFLGRNLVFNLVVEI